MSKKERDSIMRTGVIQSLSGQTFFTSDHFTSGLEARRRLALPDRPEYRVGPVDGDRMPPFDAAADRVADPAFGQPGGGHECATTYPVDIRDTDVRIDLLEV